MGPRCPVGCMCAPVSASRLVEPVDSSGRGRGLRMEDFYVTIPYGAVVVAGGVAGYVKRGSTASLAAGASIGGALLAGALSAWTFSRGESGSVFATVLQTGPSTLFLLPFPFSPLLSRSLVLVSHRPMAVIWSAWCAGVRAATLAYDHGWVLQLFWTRFGS
jgi:uncharacterized membrane protein (UPF0136 family)